MAAPASMAASAVRAALRGYSQAGAAALSSTPKTPSSSSWTTMPQNRSTPRRSFSSSHIASKAAAAPLASSSSSAAETPTPSNASDTAEKTLKRFWKTVSVQHHPAGALSSSTSKAALPAHYTVNLDGRAVRTPSGSVLRVPEERALLAGLIAQEWHEQRKVLKPHALPLTSLVARAIDGLSTPSTRQGVAESLLAYLDTDTILFHEPEPEPLVRLQSERWTPLIDWASKRFGVRIEAYTSLFNTSQNDATRQALGAHIQALDPLRLAAFERAVLSSKSFLIALGLLERALTVEDASRAAEVEVASQIERWGEVEDTHDVDYHDIRRQLGSVALVLMPPNRAPPSVATST